MRFPWAIVVLGLLSASSCGIPQETQELLDSYNQRIRILERQVEEIVPLVSCPQDIQQLFESVRDECKNGLCGTSQINAAATELDPERRNKFFEYIRLHFVHEVVYVAPGETEVTNISRRAFVSHMLGYPAFRKTRYLLIASDAKGREDALQRAGVVKKLLLALNLPPVWTPEIWPYGFKLKLDSLRSRDRPLPIGEPSDVTLGIWLFRVDC